MVKLGMVYDIDLPTLRHLTSHKVMVLLVFNMGIDMMTMRLIVESLWLYWGDDVP
jgi:hypothetical protein